MNIKRILAATDFSDAAHVAARRAVCLANASGSGLELVHALNLPPLMNTWRALVKDDGLSEAQLRTSALRRLDEFALSLITHAEQTPATHVVIGKPAQALATWAHESQANLIVTGAQGEHLLPNILVGSTVLKLLRLTSTPVLLVKQEPAADYERVLIATDFSSAAHAAAEQVAELLPEADLYLFHAYEVLFEREMSFAGCSKDTIDHYRLHAEAQTKQQMREFIDTLTTPARYLSTVRHGYPPLLIKQQVQEMRADLLVLGTSRQSEIEAALLGSVAAHLVNESSQDLLLVPNVNS